MKTFLLAGVAIGALSLSSPARAQWEVVDIPLTAIQQSEAAATASSWAAQAKDMTTSIATLNSQLTQAQMLYRMMNDPVALLGAAPGLLTGGQQSPLGTDFNAVIGLASGLGRLAGTASGLVSQIENQNTYYLPPLNGNFLSTLLTLRANQTSAVQAQLQTLLGGMGPRLLGLQELQTQINMGGDVNRMASLQARMSSEMAMAQNQGQQVAALVGLSQIQQQVESQQMQQKGALDDNQFLASRTAAAGGLVNFTPDAGNNTWAPTTLPPSFPVAGQ